jgi:alanine dehydrogenase
MENHMKFGIPAETHPDETRHAALPQTVKALTPADHHTILVQSGSDAGRHYGHHVASALA